MRKEKHRRHKRRVEAKLRVLGEGERAERKARAQLVDQWLADVFAIDEGRPVSSGPCSSYFGGREDG